MNARLKEAMKARDERVVSVLRMIRAKVMEHQNEATFDGDLSDEVLRSIIAAYVKQLQKALPDCERAGEAARGTVEHYRFEIEYLSRFLPALYDEATTRDLVAKAMQKLGVTDPKKAGQVMGSIMKEHRGKVDAALVRRVVDEVFGGS
jgi:uncharacterized protein YqeY